jgi:hypothetical protein
MMSEGRSAACPFDDSGHGRREKKMTSTSLTMLCDIMAITVGAASLRIVRYGASALGSGRAVLVAAMMRRALPGRLRRRGASSKDRRG